MPMVDLPLEELKKYLGKNPRPDDIDEYWNNNLKLLDDIDPEVELIKVDFPSPYAEAYHLYYTSVNGARVHAKFLKPKRVEGKLPALLEFHGYENNSGDWSTKLKYVANGMCIVSMDCRGQGGLSEDVGGVKGPTFRGHVIRGLEEGKDKLLYRDIFLDTVLLARILMGMEFIDDDRIATTGYSQGGALSLACACLEERIKKVFAVYPFLSDYKRVWEMDLGGEAYLELFKYFRFFDPKHEREDEIFETLGYIDLQHLAHRIKAEVNMATGLIDNICPASTQFALYNKIQAKKDMTIYPDYGHEKVLPKLEDKIYQWSLTI